MQERVLPHNKVLALIMAGGAGSRLDMLTEHRAKPAMPYAGVYRLIDFPLSNCMHSQISDVWIVQQYQPQSLNDHISNGRPWDLDRTHGGLRLLQPHLGSPEGGWHEGNADAIYRNKSFIAEIEPDILLVLSADHVYKLDYRKVLEHHRDRGAALTMVTSKVTMEEASRFGVVEVDDDGRIVDYQSKPDSPSTDVVTTEVFVFDANKLLNLLEELAEASEGKSGGSERSLEDLGDDVLPSFVKEGNTYEYRLEGYWRDLGTVDTYWQSHMELLSDDPPLALADPDWPIHTLGAQRPPARIYPSAHIDRSLISSDCIVRGRVERSVLAPGVVVETDAVVRDSVVLHETVIEHGASVDCAIVDTEARLEKGAKVGERLAGPDVPEESRPDIVLVGHKARVAAGDEVPPGGRVKLDPA